MCLIPQPPSQSAPATPTPVAQSPVAPLFNDSTSTDTALVSANRKGRKSLKIDLTSPDATGLNIPT